MVETPTRRRVDPGPTAGGDPEWEIFTRDEPGDPARHAGTIRAPDTDEAYREATRLFAWYAEAVWVCPADAVTRYVGEGADGEPVPVGERDESRTREL